MNDVTENARAPIPLGHVRATGWYARIREQSPDYEQAEDVIGGRFLAFSLVAGLRVVALGVDKDVPLSSAVSFVAGEEPEVYQVPLMEFRRAVTQILLAPEPALSAVPEKPSRELLQSFLGVRSTLLADVFGIVLKQIVFRNDEALVKCEIPQDGLDEPEVRELNGDEFRSLIRELLQSELDLTIAQMTPRFESDYVARARLALAEKNYDFVVDMLEDWPRKLSTFLRLSQGVGFPEDTVANVSEGLLLLARAYRQIGRLVDANECIRTLLQWQPYGPFSAEGYGELGQLLFEQGHYGQATAFFRRATTGGANKAPILPLLAECFAARGRYVAAALCLREAKELLGSEDAALSMDENDRTLRVIADLEKRVAVRLGDAWTAAQGELRSDDQSV